MCPYHLRKNEENSRTSFDAAIKVIDRLKELGCQIIVFEGGEPLLWKDGSHTFSDLVSYSKDKFLCTAITTNGTFPLDVPADIIWVSIDGTKKIQDRLRSNSFDRVLHNLNNTTHHKVFIHFTANRENQHDMEPLFIALNKNKPCKRNNPSAGTTHISREKKTFSLSYNERKTVIEKAIELKNPVSLF